MLDVVGAIYVAFCVCVSSGGVGSAFVQFAVLPEPEISVFETSLEGFWCCIVGKMKETE